MRRKSQFKKYQFSLYIILQQVQRQMDLIMSMVSIVKDINAIDREYRNLNLQLKYNLNKANLILGKYNKENSQIAFMIQNLRDHANKGENLTRKLDELLNTDNLAIKDKIRLSMPFNQTKAEIVFAIESLQKIVNDIKTEAPQQFKQTKVENKQGGVKRRILESSSNSQNQNINQVNSKTQLQTAQTKQSNQSADLMGPTIKQDEIIYSQTNKKPLSVEFVISIRGNEDVLQLIQSEQKQLLQTKVKLDQSNANEQVVLYQVNRMKFTKFYSKLKAITKDIDRISTKGHFNIVAKKNSGPAQQNFPITQQKVVETILQSSMKKQGKARISGSQKQEEEFFSFPVENRSQAHIPFNLFARKEDKSKALYQLIGGEWIKIQQLEIEILNGTKLAAFVDPYTKQTSIYFEICYSIEGM